mmetsp:Transcript_17443/g.36222  ORF Transcript_17443/g.36222 Transcript_17443/m.36222 type:complete len:211 (-) Transcript_17443:64-696(-)
MLRAQNRFHTMMQARRRCRAAARSLTTSPLSEVSNRITPLETKNMSHTERRSASGTQRGPTSNRNLACTSAASRNDPSRVAHSFFMRAVVSHWICMVWSLQLPWIRRPAMAMRSTSGRRTVCPTADTMASRAGIVRVTPRRPTQIATTASSASAPEETPSNSRQAASTASSSVDPFSASRPQPARAKIPAILGLIFFSTCLRLAGPGNAT